MGAFEVQPPFASPAAQPLNPVMPVNPVMPLGPFMPPIMVSDLGFVPVEVPAGGAHPQPWHPASGPGEASGHWWANKCAAARHQPPAQRRKRGLGYTSCRRAIIRSSCRWGSMDPGHHGNIQGHFLSLAFLHNGPIYWMSTEVCVNCIKHWSDKRLCCGTIVIFKRYLLFSFFLLFIHVAFKNTEVLPYSTVQYTLYQNVCSLSANQCFNNFVSS